MISWFSPNLKFTYRFADNVVVAPRQECEVMHFQEVQGQDRRNAIKRSLRLGNSFLKQTQSATTHATTKSLIQLLSQEFSAISARESIDAELYSKRLLSEELYFLRLGFVGSFLFLMVCFKSKRHAYLFTPFPVCWKYVFSQFSYPEQF